MVIGAIFSYWYHQECLSKILIAQRHVPNQQFNKITQFKREEKK